jgi:hypothetical protein
LGFIYCGLGRGLPVHRAENHDLEADAPALAERVGSGRVQPMAGILAARA